MTGVHFETPTLDTRRLHLRGPKPSDAETFMAFYATERAQYVGGPMQPWQAWGFFGTEMGHWIMRGYGMWVVTMRGDDTPLGIVGHWCPQGWPETEVGWVLFNEADEGRGIAYEAAKACVEYAWDVLEWDTAVSYIAPKNTRSIALAKRLGAVVDPDAEQPMPDKICLVYRHPKPEGRE